ncbi:alkaline phosphatase [Nocardioides marmoriginsengisoli]|uniref:Alkaline phosphatase n=1 Tax=Nocardioides marmoriginsengisoli TaxID=661483 RepID=A0A3N0CJU8_9ACTN|nr:alkaline phosphatase D family protein [Nocardioides marmoriginsengisoli]RNL63213.1 alkaline phosphatase [Nocardioides marmoriginsengisoli]
MPELSRRTLIATGLGGGAVLAMSQWSEAVAAGAPFVHGVASGDPLPNAVILWTRITPSVEATPGSGAGPVVSVDWEVSTNASFSGIVASGTTSAGPDTDHTVHVDAGGLQPGTKYWYRFRALDATSPVGRTKTAAAPGTSTPVRFGVVSCANYNWGYFTGYQHLAQEPDLDSVLHLGDYIYEYAPGGVLAKDIPKTVRTAEPQRECLTLTDYRIRHGFYKLEPNLQQLHAAHPMVAVWDDHEIANDTWKNGAENHDPATEGDWATRASAGRRAWLEWLPVRHTDPDDWYRINRRLRFGDLVDLWMLDERRFRDQPPKSLLFGYGAAGGLLGGTSSKPGRGMIGEDQTHWLVDGLAASSAKWKVVGNQVPFYPTVLLASVPGQITDVLGPQLSKVFEQPLVQLQVEDWNGFLDERQRIVDGMAGVDNVVILTGDVHQSYASEIPVKPSKYLLDRKSAAVEYITPGVASPSLQTQINQIAPGIGTLLNTVLATNDLLANPWVKYSEGFKAGYLVVDFSSTRVQADFHHLADNSKPNTTVKVAASYQTLAGTKRVTKAPGPLS